MLAVFSSVSAAGAANPSAGSQPILKSQKAVLDTTSSRAASSLPPVAPTPVMSKRAHPVTDYPYTVPSAGAAENAVSAGPEYGKPLANTIEREAATQRQEGAGMTATSADTSASSANTRGSSADTSASSLDASGSSADAGSVSSTASTLAPFHRANNMFAPLRSIQFPRPLNIPRDASPALKEAAAMIPNLSVVSPSLIRGSQPSVPSLSLLKTAGVKTIINLRNEPILIAQEASAAKRAGIDYVNIPMALFDTPTRQQFQKFLSIVDNNGPVFVHCQMGEDRTGTMVAVYRIARQGWDPNRAYQEMTAMGFKSFLGSLSGAVFDYSASLGRPGHRPGPDFGGFASILKH